MKLSLALCHLEATRSRLPTATERPIVTTHTPTPYADASQPSTTKHSSSRQQPPVIALSRGDSSVVDTRPNMPGDFASPSASNPSSARLYQPCTPRNLVERNSILAASRLGTVNHANASFTPVNTIPPNTAALTSATMRTTLPPTPSNPISHETTTVATSSLPPTNTHSSSGSFNLPLNGNLPTSSPAITSTNHSTAHANTAAVFKDTLSSLPMTRPQQKFLMNGIQRMSKRRVALLFSEPVKESQVKIMGIGNYFDVITKPMDLRTMEEKLKNAQYSNIDEYVADFAQIVENTVRFNGPDHSVTQDAYELRETFEKQVRDACQGFAPDAEKAHPMLKNGRPRKYRRVGEEVMELLEAKEEYSDSGDCDSDEEAYIPSTHRRRSTARGSGQYARRGISS
ncbi:hypothetical protein MMC30_007026 [Trapelia coarctata]|nr:hypothetical protein [Trapelia coarctata]